MKEKIKKILNLRFLIILLTIILIFTLTTYWRNETQKSIKDWEKKNEIESGKEISTEKFTTMIKYKTYTWDITYRKIWTYDLLILISGILLFIVFGQSDNHTMKESTKKKLQELLVRALQEKKDQQQEKEE